MRNIQMYRMPPAGEALGFAIRDHTRATRTERPHRHEFFQMRLDVAGEADHHIGAKRRRLRPGSLSFIAPYRIHRGGRGGDSEFYVINFHHRFLRPGLSVDSACIDRAAIATAPELAPFAFEEQVDFQLNADELALARNACKAMLEQYRRPRFFSVDVLRAQLLLLIGMACQSHERELSRLMEAREDGRRTSDPLTKVKRYIGEHLTDQIGLSDAAAAADLSPNYVTQLLKKETGKTFVDFITALRLQKAQELLANTSMRITEVSAAVGYTDDAYFARRFRQFLQVSPGEYRRSAAASHQP